MKTFTWTHKAQYYETDQMGIIHHSNYIRWFEEARVFFLESIGYPYDRLEQEGILSPVLEINCQYLSMTAFGDSVEIKTYVKAFNGVRMTFGYEIYDAATGEIRAKGSSSHCFIDKQKKLLSLKRSYPEIYRLLTDCL